jgi:hypothetical protein
MRRDEIKIFPGNVETHINRLHHLGDASSTPLAREAPSREDAEHGPQLQYGMRSSMRSRILASLEIRRIDLTSACALLLATSFLVYGFWYSNERWIVAVALTVGMLIVPPVAWVMFHFINRRPRRR